MSKGMLHAKHCTCRGLNTAQGISRAEEGRVWASAGGERHNTKDVQQTQNMPYLLCRVTNPHEFEVDGVAFLGTSGQNIEDIDRYSTDEDRLRMLEHVLEWGHLAPTAPDTLTAYSFSDKDPFVIESAPHVLFAGNQPSLTRKLVEGEP